MEINIPSYEIKGIFIPTGIFVLNFIPVGYDISTRSVRQGCLKRVKVVPIFKNKGFPFEKENYRPNSFLSNVDKILEQLGHKIMMQFLEKNKILRDRQFGFRKKHSTVHGLVTSLKNRSMKISRAVAYLLTYKRRSIPR